VLETIFRENWSALLERIHAVEQSDESAREQLRHVAAILLRTWRHEPDVVRVLVRGDRPKRGSAGADRRARQADRSDPSHCRTRPGERRVSRRPRPALAAVVFYGGIDELLTGWVLGQLPDGDAEVAAAEHTVVESCAPASLPPLRRPDHSRIRNVRRRIGTAVRRLRTSTSAVAGPRSAAVADISVARIGNPRLRHGPQAAITRPVRYRGRLRGPRRRWSGPEPRTACRSSAARSGSGCDQAGAGRQRAGAHDFDNRVLCRGDLGVAVGQLAQHQPVSSSSMPRRTPPLRARGRGRRETRRSPGAFDNATDRSDRLDELADPLLHFRASGDLPQRAHADVGLVAPRCEAGSQRRGAAARAPIRRIARRRGCARAVRSSSRGRSSEHLVLRREVVVEQPVRDAGFLGDVARRARCGSPSARTHGRPLRGSDRRFSSAPDARAPKAVAG